MTPAAAIAAGFAIGMVVGSLYVRALWATVERLPQSRRPGIALVAGGALRCAAVAAALVAVARWLGGPSLAGAVIAFSVARHVGVERRARPPARSPA